MKLKSVFVLIVIAMLVTACGKVSAPTQALPANPNTGESYTVNITTADFVTGIDNPYLPLVPGAKWLYEARKKDGGLERIEIEILNDTRVVNGVTAVVLHDTVYVDNVVVEETFDWFAQDKGGNVWYLGEQVDNYENGVFVDHAGSWEWGIDGALPGVYMWADPSIHVDQAYYQEYYVGVAQDMGQILSVAESVDVPAGSFENVVQTHDFSSLDPNIQGLKFYAPGIGSIKEVELLTGEELNLIQFTPAGEQSPVVNIPVAPENQRVDLVQPTFSTPTNVTNPLFPYSRTDQIILLGSIDGQPFHVIYTLLPTTRKIDWNGQQVETIIVQYVAKVNGQIEEYALDWYAQADDGSVWYFGEDVFDYQDGVVVKTDGTWLVGRDGPLAMIMPANPQVGDVYRVENIPGVAFEEITVTATNVTVQGPLGLVEGAMIGEQLHMDGSYSNKTFVPGYGEFVTITGTELEALALAVPTDALPGPAPAELDTLSRGASSIFDAAQAESWNEAATALDSMVTAWNAHQADNVPILLESQMSASLNTLVGAVNARQIAEARLAALNVAQASLDLQLQYRPPAEVDLERFKFLTQQVLVDAEIDEPGSIKSDVVLLELIRDRFIHTLDSALAADLNTLLDDLRTSADAEDLEASAETARKLLDILSGLNPGG